MIPRYIFAPLRALSSVGSEHLPYKQGVGGSNPSAPTPKRKKAIHESGWLFCFGADEVIAEAFRVQIEIQDEQMDNQRNFEKIKNQRNREILMSISKLLTGL